MPIYEYQCQSCGNEHDALQKMSDDPLIVCPACSKSELKKKISAAGFRLKGKGWYETDFKGESKKNGAGSKPDSISATPSAKTSGNNSGGDSSCSQ